MRRAAVGVTPGDLLLLDMYLPDFSGLELVRRLGSESVAAVDPSESFVEACRRRKWSSG